jgi:periplasmic protein TonB
MAMPAKLTRFIPLVIGVLLTAAVIYFAISILSASDDEQPRKKVVQQVTIIVPPPPPPPPPEQEPEVQEPEDEEVVEEMDEAMPDEGMDEDVGNDLGMDADGSAGGDGFGLMARKGGRGLIGGGYGALVVQEINSMLVEHERLRGKEYTVILQLWISETGEIERYRIDRTKADNEVVAMLEDAITRMGSVSSGPPLELPQPIRLRIKSRL